MSNENREVELEQRINDLEFTVVFLYMLFQTDIKRKVVEAQQTINSPFRAPEGLRGRFFELISKFTDRFNRS